jgi:predicted RND superfamily exporter protein
MQKQLDTIYDWFEHASRVIVRFRWLVILCLLVITGLAMLGLPKLTLDDSTEGFLLEGAEIKKAQNAFEELFGNNDYAAFLIEADDVFSPRMLAMLRQLGDELLAEVEFADKVVSIADMEISRTEDDMIITEELVPDDIPEDPEGLERIRTLAYSKSHLIDNIFTADATQTWLTLSLLPFPDEWQGEYKEPPANLVGKKILEILAQPTYQDHSIKPIGMLVTDVEEMNYFEKETPRLLSIAMGLALVILGVFLRSWRGIVIPVITTIVSIVIVFGYMGHLETTIPAAMMSMPILLSFAVSIGYSIHIFNYFTRHFVTTGKRKESVYCAVRETGWPMLFTAMTTIGALISFCFIALVPIQWLGIASAASIFSVYLLVMTLTPALLSFGKEREPKQIEHHDNVLWTDTYFGHLGELVHTYSLPLIIGFVLMTTYFVWGLTKLEINLDFKRLYGDKLPHINRMFEVSNSKIGSFYSYNATLAFQEPDTIKDPYILQNFETFLQEIQSLKVTKRVSSILDIIKDMHQLLNENDPEFYTIPDDQNFIAQILLLYEMSGGTEATEWVDNDYTTLRVMVEVDDIDTEEIRRELDFLETTADRLFPEAAFSITGQLPIMAALNYYVSTGQIRSFLVALVVIMVLLMIVFKSVKTGLIGMIPNITPALIVGGAMGHLNVPIDYVTMTMMPMILGLAVDDTIHFIAHAHLEYNRLRDYRQAIKNTLRITGRALFMTSFILVAAFAVYLTADMRAMVNFGMFIVLGISSALLADYLITPVCLKWLKPFGKDHSSPQE